MNAYSILVLLPSDLVIVWISPLFILHTFVVLPFLNFPFLNFLCINVICFHLLFCITLSLLSPSCSADLTHVKTKFKILKPAPSWTHWNVCNLFLINEHGLFCPQVFYSCVYQAFLYLCKSFVNRNIIFWHVWVSFRHIIFFLWWQLKDAEESLLSAMASCFLLQILLPIILARLGYLEGKSLIPVLLLI